MSIYSTIYFISRGGGIGRHACLRSMYLMMWRFESSPRHQGKLNISYYNFNMLFLKILFIPALSRVLSITENPKLCAGISTFFFFLSRLLLLLNEGTSRDILILSLVLTPIIFLIHWAYFSLLYRFDDTIFAYLLILLLGILFLPM